MKYLAYQITGLNDIQKALFIIGSSASNGKSLLAEYMIDTFQNYTHKLPSDAFSVKYDQFHKQMDRMRAPCRFAVIEELKDEQMDVERFKDFINGAKQNNKIMYGTSELIDCQTSLVILSNQLPRIRDDNGSRRRGFLVEFKNIFVDQKDMENNVYKNMKNVYVKDEAARSLCKKDVYRNAFIRIILENMEPFYNERFNDDISIKYSEAFKAAASTNDVFRTFIEENYIKTDDDKDKIHKSELKNHYKLFNKAERDISDITFLNNIKRVGMVYNKSLRMHGFDTRGCIVGYKRRAGGDINEDLLNSINEEEPLDVVDRLDVVEHEQELEHKETLLYNLDQIDVVDRYEQELEHDPLDVVEQDKYYKTKLHEEKKEYLFERCNYIVKSL